MNPVAELALNGAMAMAATACGLWVAGALYFDVCRASRLGRWVAGAWLLAASLLLVFWHPLWQPAALILAATTVLFAWWLGLEPSNDRVWETSVARLPRAAIEGDTVTVANLRNFQYRSLIDFEPRYETRSYRLSQLRGADVIFFNWGSAWMSHPVMVFDFGPGGRLCISIEVRYRQGQKYSVLRSLYRQQELIFVVADERDVILRRTKFEPRQEARLYHLRATIDELRTALLDYLQEVNALAGRPRWYHGVCANCTTSFYRLPHNRIRWDWRVIANNHLDQALYADGRLDTRLPLSLLRERSRIDSIANQAPEAGFGDYVRKELARCRDA